MNPADDAALTVIYLVVVGCLGAVAMVMVCQALSDWWVFRDKKPRNRRRS